MDRKRLDVAVAAVHAFLEAVGTLGEEDAAAKREREAQRERHPGYYGPIDYYRFENPSRYVAAVKRRSLDLTRALADLRARGR